MANVSSTVPLHSHGADLNPTHGARLRTELLETSALRNTGILRHGTHFADLILLAPTPHRAAEASLFLLAARHLTRALDTGKMEVLNEKIDGSPAIVIGRDEAGAPFVAYKGGIERKSGPQLLKSPSDAERFFFRSPGLKALMEETAAFILPRIPSCLPANQCIQADLLFTPSNGARQVSESEVSIRANPSGIDYVLSPESPFFNAAATAPLGLVLHTPALMNRAAAAAVETSPIHDPSLVLEVSRALSEAGLFSCHPYRFNVPLVVDNWRERRSEAFATLEKIGQLLQGVAANSSEDFSRRWLALAPKLCTFFNSALYPPGKGGIYRAAALGEDFDFERLRQGFERWMWLRKLASNTPGRDEVPVADLFSREAGPIRALLESYFLANRFFYQIRPALDPAFKSKLGGGPAEGFMVGSIKVVDRLQFTMANFSRPSRRQGGAVHKLKYPFNTWRPGDYFLLIKAEPPHRGHAALIHAAVEAAKGKRVFVLLSSTQPNLRAKTWKDLNAARTKGELVHREFTHPFSRALRRRLLASMAEGAKVVMVESKDFFLYLAWARTQGHEGKIKLVVGEKEVAGGKYASQLQLFGNQLELEPLPLAAGGLRATEVRAAIASASQGDTAAREVVKSALSYISSEAERECCIELLLSEWRRIDKAAERVLRKKKRARKASNP